MFFLLRKFPLFELIGSTVRREWFLFPQRVLTALLLAGKQLNANGSVVESQRFHQHLAGVEGLQHNAIICSASQQYHALLFRTEGYF